MFITVFQHIKKKKPTLPFRGLHFKIKTMVLHVILYYYYNLMIVKL